MSEHRNPLRRSRGNRIIAGVCGGMAEFFGIPSFWFRMAFLVALIPGGIPGLLAYILLWIIVPSE
jgi:phage shock protein C